MFLVVVLAWLTATRTQADQSCTDFGETAVAPDDDLTAHTYIEDRTIGDVQYLQAISVGYQSDIGRIRVGLFTKSTGDMYTARHLTDWLNLGGRTVKLTHDKTFLTDPNDHLGWIMEENAGLNFDESSLSLGYTGQVIFEEEGEQHVITTDSQRKYSLAVTFCSEIDPCGSSPCQHLGTCVSETDGSYSCLCQTTYQGPNCEINTYEEGIYCDVLSEAIGLPMLAIISGPFFYLNHERMTASSQLDSYYPAASARIEPVYPTGYAKYWAAQDQSIKENPDDPEWIQVDLVREYRLLQVVTEGSRIEYGHVTSYRLLFSLDGATWYGSGKPYRGNHDDTHLGLSRTGAGTTLIENTPWEDTPTRFVRLIPLTYARHIALRFEVSGCLASMEDVVIASEGSLPEVYINGVQIYPSVSTPPLYNFRKLTSITTQIIAFRLQSNSTLQDGVLVHAPEVFSVSGDRGWKCLAADDDVPAQGCFRWYSHDFDDSSWPDAVLVPAPSIELPEHVTNITAIEWIWAENVESTVYCRGFVDPCYRQPCYNNGSCFALEAGEFNCTNCLAGYEGRLCETDTDECLSQPCVNGLCRDLLDGFECHCFSGFEGELCESPNELDCSSDPCVNGTCEDQLGGGFLCSCDLGYEGDLCNVDTNDCARNLCLHGKCSDLVGGYSCNCFPGFAGELCTIDLNECASEPCAHGTCLNRFNSFYCVCPRGYEGVHCATEINECLSDPCVHGSCEDRVGKFHCVCDEGRKGKHCSEEVNNCKSNPCLYGSCVNLPGGVYECTCLPGFEGVHCDIEIDECRSDPCSPGECMDTVNNYICKCPDGYYKKFC